MEYQLNSPHPPRSLNAARANTVAANETRNGTFPELHENTTDSHPSLIYNSIHRHSHNMSKYTNDGSSPVKRQSPIRACALSCVSVPSHQCLLFFIIFSNFLNKINKIMDPTMKSKENVKVGFVNQRIAN